MPFPSLFDAATASKCSRALARRDARFAPIFRACGPVRLPPRTKGGAFAFLVRTVVYQQLAIGAAAAIHARLLKRVAGPRAARDAKRILRAGPEALRAAGRSSGKTRTVIELAEAVASGAFSPRSLSRYPDEEVRARITALRGFGPWSADIFSMFHLGRTDVFPAGDLGLRRGTAELHGGDAPWSEKRLESHAERWRPYRSVAAWALWHRRSGRPPGLDDRD